MSEARGLGRETLWYGLANLLVGGLGFGQLYVFTRLLSPAEFGVYFLILSAAAILNSLGFAWINQTAKRYLPGLAPAERPEFLGKVLAAYLLTCCLLLALALLAAVLLPLFGQPAWLPWPVLALTAGTGAVNYVQWLYTIERRAADYTLNQLFYNGGRLVLGWLLLTQWHASGAALSWAVSAAGVGAGLLGALHLREPLRVSGESFSRATLAAFAAYGLPLALVNGGGWLLTAAGRIILQPLAGPAAVGIFSAAQQLAQQLVTLAVQPVITGADPLAIRLHARDGADATARFLSQLFGLVMLLGSGVCVVLALLAQPLTAAVLGGPEYAGTAELYAWLAPAMLCWLLIPVLAKSHEIGEKLGELPWLVLGAGGLNIALNFALIPRFDAAGAAVAALAANALLAAACYWLGRRHLHWRLPYRLLALGALALGALLGVHALLPQPQGVWQVAGAFTLYMLGYLGLCLGAMLLLRTWFYSELTFLRMIASRRVEG
jgi:O-antigen/teichoic acid export membrane protein